MKNLAIIIVTYNRLKELKLNLESLNSQRYNIDKIFIVNNASTDKTKLFLDDSNLVLKYPVKVMHLNENIGSAGGFYEGLKNAHEEGYSFYWMMDDDGRPDNNLTLKNIMTKAIEIQKQHKYILLNSLVIFNEEEMSFGLSKIPRRSDIKDFDKDGLVLNTINPFNGTLVNNALINKIGFPKKEYFIKGDEIEFLTRAAKNNAFVATVTNSIFFHPKMEKNEIPWKYYYRVRNYTHMRKYTYLQSAKFLLSQTKNIIINKPQKMKRIRYLIIGFYHAKKNKLGINKHIMPIEKSID